MFSWLLNSLFKILPKDKLYHTNFLYILISRYTNPIPMMIGTKKPAYHRFTPPQKMIPIYLDEEDIEE